MNAIGKSLSFRSLQAKFLAIAVPLVLLTTVALFAVIQLNAQRTANLNLQSKLQEVIAIQRSSLAGPLWNVDENQVSLILAAMDIDPEILGAAVYDESGGLVAEVGSMTATDHDVFASSAPIEFEGETIGSLEVALSDKLVREAARERLQLAGGIAALLVLSVVLSILLAHRRTVGTPLRLLSESIRASREEGVRQSVDWRSQDEMGAVVSAYNDMQQRQESDERALIAARDNLEQRVEERTRELASTQEKATLSRDEAMRARSQLTDAIETISEGFSLYGPDDKLLVYNSRYLELLYPGADDEIELGMSFEAVVRKTVECGYIDGIEGKEEEWITERLERHRNPEGPHLQRRPGGRVIQINERRTENGSVVATYTDLTELMRAEQALRDSEERLRAFYNNSPFEIYLKDTHGRYAMVNRQLEKMHGLSGDAIIGKTSHDIYPTDLADAVTRHDRAVIESGKVISDEYEVPLIDGIHIMVTEKFPVPSAEGGIAGIGAISIDITERKEKERELADLVEKLEVARDEAEAANQAKSAFLATMSHEIRTPMNSVVGMTSLLLDTEQTPEQREFTEIIRNSSDALLTIINDILDFSKIEAGKLELERQEFGLRDCVQGALDLLAGKAAEKGLELAYVFAPDTPEAVVGDISRLRQILVNLLNNALKFTEEGEVVVSINCETQQTSQSPTGDQTLHFSVRDTGIGIPSDRMNRLFQAFSQVDASISRRHGGTGLGLAICKRLSELMGGTMWVESTEGEGSEFHFTIRVGEVASTEYDYLHEIQPQLRMKHMLVVESNPTNQSILSQQAMAWGLQPRLTASAEEALDWVRGGEHFDIVVVEKNMPDMDGARLCRAIRELHDTEALPIILVAPLGGHNSGTNETYFDALLSKPIKPSQFFDILVDISSGKQVTRRMQETESVSSFDADMGKRYPLRILLTEDNVNNQKLALLVLGRLGYRADVAGNGIEALDALRRQAYDLVLMDVQMPDMDGLEATREIRRLWSEKHRPWIVAMTANAMQGDREMCLQAGMNDYVTKPIRLENVIASLKFGWESLQGEVVEAPSTIAEDQALLAGEDANLTASPVDGTDVLDPSALKRLEELAGGDKAFLIEFIDTFLGGAPKMVGDMKKSVNDGDANTLRRVAHTLKSNSAALGASRLSTLCKELEDLGKSEVLNDAPEKVRQVELEFEPIEVALAAIREDYGG